jgi:DNA-binding transcriptional MocR family regulator
MESQKQFIDDLKTIRLQVMNAIYEALKGRPDVEFVPDLRQLADEIGLESDVVFSAFEYLKGEGLVSNRGVGLVGAKITHNGIKEMERAIEHPDSPTQYFPPLNVTINNHNHIGHGAQIVIAQASPGATINSSFGAQPSELAAVIASLREAIAQSSDIQADQRAVALETVAIIESSSADEKADASKIVNTVNDLISILNIATTNPVTLDLGRRLLGFFVGHGLHV